MAAEQKQICPKDVIPGQSCRMCENGTGAEDQIRCNQIWALTLPFTMVERDRAEQILRTVFRELYTPWGLRSLSPRDPAFHPVYGGPHFDRDMAYHQGTVWGFPLGAFYKAWIRYAEEPKAAARQVLGWLEALEPALAEGCLGQLAEIYDGLEPNQSRGCYAQAWSVGELLAAYEYAEQVMTDCL